MTKIFILALMLTGCGGIAVTSGEDDSADARPSPVVTHHPAQLIPGVPAAVPTRASEEPDGGR